MTLREFVRTVWTGKYYVLAAVLVVVAAAVFYVDRQDTVYRASATVELISVQTAQGGDELVDVTVSASTDDVRSEPVAEAAAEALGHEGEPRELLSQVSASADESGATIEVSAESLDEGDAVEVANAFAAAYVTQLGVLQNQEIDYLESRRSALADQLSDVARQLRIDPENPLALAEQELIVAEYTTLTVQLNTLRSIEEPAIVSEPAAGAEALGMAPATVVAIAMLAGLVAGIGLAFARRGLDIRVRSAGDAARVTGTPVLAEIYGVRLADKDFQSTHALPVTSKVATPFTESIRELRTAVQVAMTDAPHAVVVVTAADRHGSRAFVAANLAASFALSGLRTVAVSGDLRQPQLDDLLPPPHGWAGHSHALRPTDVRNLSVFPVPEEELDPADYLATARVRDLIGNLRLQCDVTVIDAPPALAAADATILGQYATGVVLVAAAGQTDRAVLIEAVERLRTNNVPLSGIALAGVKGDRRMLYASTYGEVLAAPQDEHSTSQEPGARAEAARALVADGDAQDSKGGSAAQLPVEENAADSDPESAEPERVATESTGSDDRAAAQVATPSSQPTRAQEPSTHAQSRRAASVGDQPPPEPRPRPKAPATGSNGKSRQGPLLSPNWGKVTTPPEQAPSRNPASGETGDAAGSGPEDDSDDGDRRPDAEGAVKLPFRW
ncbi:hypothetical protein [Oerskovia flava]|uniref:hypothetical protein n=1 Tax=Oerskovia flava TaxID=2986422 RepID=UPI0022405760|nr:hypothetical protein [Oerskovia sp. JB1-3-2]